MYLITLNAIFSFSRLKTRSGRLRVLDRIDPFQFSPHRLRISPTVTATIAGTLSSGPSMTSDHASSHAPSMTSVPAKSDDLAWANGYKQDKERRERISKAVGEGASYQALDEEEESSLDRRTSGDGTKQKRSKKIGGFFAPRTTPGAQPSIKSALSSKQTIDEARMAVARWPSFMKKKEVARGMIQALTVLVPDEHLQDQISAQMEEYKQATCDFNMPLAIRQREKLPLVSWWEHFGDLVPDLQKFAIQVLSQCCNATGCERNWSTFEFIHSKKRNRVEHKRLNDLVYVRYNLKLRERIIRRTKDALDPISLENIDVLEDWVSEEPSLLDEEDIPWEIIEPPSLEALTLDVRSLTLMMPLMIFQMRTRASMIIGTLEDTMILMFMLNDNLCFF
ncbi:hypothetical protein RHSIM_Rhsim05G0071000 [Rhododendron simsii]|uniref:HAT C-terminal dimerisation domain-containing protein n=1 Tax=Rhododendron simsii TaxID=118357 RepID=A0A834H3V8_RHOSS|nr:hypothetical protein RHSIM_Rhsim05G0071000 [Rhododendron simsii]